MQDAIRSANLAVLGKKLLKKGKKESFKIYEVARLFHPGHYYEEGKLDSFLNELNAVESNKNR